MKDVIDGHVANPVITVSVCGSGKGLVRRSSLMTCERN